MIYKFDWLNNGLEIINPTIEDKITLTGYDLDTKIGTVMVSLTTSTTKFGVELPPFEIPTVNKSTIRANTLNKLKDYEV